MPDYCMSTHVEGPISDSCHKSFGHPGDHVGSIYRWLNTAPQESAPDWKPTNAKDRAATTRLDISLFPMSAIAYGALGLTEGDLKYGGFNYRAGGVLASIYTAALMRHTMKWFDGEECDAKTKVPHLASMLACVAILIDAKECGCLRDDRPPKTSMPDLLNRFQEIVAHLQKTFPDGPERYTQVGEDQKHGRPPSTPDQPVQPA